MSQDDDGELAERGLVLARHYLQIDRPEQALASLRQHEQSLTGRPDAWVLRGRALLQMDRFEEASRAFELGLTLDAENVNLLYLLGFSEMRRARLAAAERHMLAALRIFPESAQILSAYAELVGRAGQFKKAHALLARAGEIDPECDNLKRVRPFLATLQGRDREAVRQAQAWVAESPDESDAHFSAAAALARVGRSGAGYRHAREAATLDPGIVDGREDWYRRQRLRTHWAMLPLVPFQRIGPAVTWALAVGIMYGLRALDMPVAALVFAAAYLALVIYSWTAPRILRHLLERKQR